MTWKREDAVGILPFVRTVPLKISGSFSRFLQFQTCLQLQRRKLEKRQHRHGTKSCAPHLEQIQVQVQQSSRIGMLTRRSMWTSLVTACLCEMVSSPTPIFRFRRGNMLCGKRGRGSNWAMGNKRQIQFIVVYMSETPVVML